MKVGQDYFPKSSFLSVEKDLSKITEQLLQNQRLMKLLYYTEKDCLSAPDLTQKEILSLINNQIKIVPYIPIETDCPINLLISFDNFIPNLKNPEFRNNVLDFVILCHPDHWLLENFSLRPFRIAGEIDSMINKHKLTGIGEVQFNWCERLVMNDQLMGLILEYSIIHGIEDKINPLA